MLTRREVRPFTDKQIELVTTFADQAVIAIENTRLLNELRTTRPSCNSRPPPPTCSRSSADRPSICKSVLHTLVESAARLCDAEQGRDHSADGWEVLSGRDLRHSRGIYSNSVQHLPVEPDAGQRLDGPCSTARLIHIPDVQTDPEYNWSEAQRLGGYRTVLAVPMLREGVAIGVLTLSTR